MKRFASVDTSVLKQHYEKKVQELEQEKRILQVNYFFFHEIKCTVFLVHLSSTSLLTVQKEIEKLRHNLANLASNSDDSAQKLKEEYLQKLNFLESQVSFLIFSIG